MKIHQEGRGFLTILFFIFIALNAGIIYLTSINPTFKGIIGGVTLIIFLFFLQFFRNPARKIDLNEKQILAPCDGKVVVIETTPEEEYFKGKDRIQVSIFMSPLNVHVNRNPVTGLI
ncbi:MAG TPA: phosphatidylserine decarboxylase, partial [Roseivirga sp.]